MEKSKKLDGDPDQPVSLERQLQASLAQTGSPSESLSPSQCLQADKKAK